jgi:hypothetical protein
LSRLPHTPGAEPRQRSPARPCLPRLGARPVPARPVRRASPAHHRAGDVSRHQRLETTRTRLPIRDCSRMGFGVRLCALRPLR